jgi:hypothetical protein
MSQITQGDTIMTRRQFTGKVILERDRKLGYRSEAFHHQVDGTKAEA